MEALFVFNRQLGSDDESATVSERMEKLLFYTSTCEDDLEEQLERLSLCEAFIDLCRSFDAGHPCESVFLDDHQYSLFECEPDTWLVICCKSRQISEGNVADLKFSISPYLYVGSSHGAKKSPIQKFTPSFRRRDSGELGFRMAKPFDAEKKLYKKGMRNTSVEDVRIFESMDPNSNVLQSLLKRLYALFTLFHGPIGRILLGDAYNPSAAYPKDSIPERIKTLRKLLRKSRDIQELVDEGDLIPDEAQQALLDNRFQYEDELASLLADSPADIVRHLLLRSVPELLNRIDFSRLHLLYDLEALPFLAVDRASFLSTQLFMTRLLDRFDAIESAALLYNGQVLWNSIQLNQLRSVFLFIEMTLAKTRSAEGEYCVPSNGQNLLDPMGVYLSLRPGFLEIAQTVEPKELAKAEDSAALYLPQVFLEATQATGRMAIYGSDRTMLVVFLADSDVEEHQDEDGGKAQDLSNNAEQAVGEYDKQVESQNEADRQSGGDVLSVLAADSQKERSESSGDFTSAQKRAWLDFCGAFESFVASEIVRLSEQISASVQNAKDSGTTNFGIDSLSLSSIQSDMGTRTSLRNLAQMQQNQLAAMDPNERYIYVNETNAVVKISDGWLAPLLEKVPNQPIYPSNKTLGMLFTTNLITAINDIRKEFQTSHVDQVTITQFVRPNAELQQPGCWVAAVKATHRQIFLVVDAKHSFEYVSQRLRVLRDTAFRSILV